MARDHNAGGQSEPHAARMGSRTRPHAFVHGTSCPSRVRRTSPKFQCQNWRVAASASCARSNSNCVKAGRWPMKRPSAMKPFMAPTAFNPPAGDVGRITAQRGRLRLMNSHGTGKIKFVWRSGVRRRIEVWKRQIVGRIGHRSDRWLHSVAREIHPFQEVTDLVATNAERDFQDLGVRYLLAERRVQARTGLLDETEVERGGWRSPGCALAGQNRRSSSGLRETCQQTTRL